MYSGAMGRGSATEAAKAQKGLFRQQVCGSIETGRMRALLLRENSACM